MKKIKRRYSKENRLLENLASAKPFKATAIALVALMPVGKFYTFLYAESNRVGGGDSRPTSHTTVRTVRYTAVRFQ